MPDVNCFDLFYYSMITNTHIDGFSKNLTGILNAELKLGNKVVETSKGWPNENTIIVFLKFPFFADYSVDGIEFRDINDIHYWKSEYFERATNHVLACKFYLTRPTDV